MGWFSGLVRGLARLPVPCLLLMGLVACANPLALGDDDESDGNAKVVYAKPNTLVALGPDRDAGQVSPNNHPATFNKLDVAYLLRDVRVDLDGSRQRGVFGRQGERQVRLFTRSTIEKLAGPLASAFGKASPKQDVIVYVEQPPQVVGADGTINVGAMMEARRVSAARLFVRKKELHIIAGAVGINPKASGDETGYNFGRGDLTLNRLKKLAPVGTRARPRDKAAPLSGDFARNRQERGRTDWLVIEYPRLLASVAGQRQDGGSAALESIDYELKDAKGEPPVQAVESAPVERSEADRLETLERLRRDGVISEAEYQRRKAEIEAASSE